MSRLYAGVDLGGTSFIAVIANRKGKVLGSSDGPTTRGAKAEETIEQIADHIREAAKEASVKMSKIRAIGIGAAGAVDPERGVVVRAPNLGWSNVPVARDLRKKLGPDVVLGFRGAAGEIGHMVVKEDGPKCSCGRCGCVEALASRSAMERDVRAARNSAVLAIMKERGKDRMTSSVIERALEVDDRVMKDVLTRAQHYLGLLTANVVNMFDPEMIVIGGGVAQRLKEKFVAPIAEVARSRFLRPDPKNSIRIEHATLGDYSGALGACALAEMNS